MMLALCTAVTLCRLLSAAYLKAYSATRVLATRVMICIMQTLAGLADDICQCAEVRHGNNAQTTHKKELVSLFQPDPA